MRDTDEICVQLYYGGCIAHYPWLLHVHSSMQRRQSLTALAFETEPEPPEHLFPLTHSIHVRLLFPFITDSA